MAGKGKFRIPTAAEMKELDGLQPKIQSTFRRPASATVQDLNNKKPVQTEPKQRNILSNMTSTATSASLSKSSTSESSNKVKLTDKRLGRGCGDVAGGVSMVTERPKAAQSRVNTDSTEKAEPVLRKDAVLQPIAKSTKSHCIVVNPRQRGNPIIKHIRNIPWEFGDTPADYELGKAACALYLSVRYHQLNPEYIHDRLKKLGRSYDLRVLLVQVDIKDPHHALKELAKICILADCTLILAFSSEEAGRYLETYKIYENKPPDAVMEKTEQNFLAKFTDCLTSVKSVNKTDCMTLLSSFGSFENVTKASVEDLSLCPGVGPQKAQRLHHVLHEPFLKQRKQKTDKAVSGPSQSTDKS